MNEDSEDTNNISNDNNNKKKSKLIEPIPDTQTNKKQLLTLPKVCKILMTIRLLLNIVGQRSYIHPDEFFQGLEPISGHVFNCSERMHLTWEFQFTNTSAPIRNIAVPYFFYGLPLFALKHLVRAFSDLNSFRNENNNLITVQANTLIYYPRIFMTLCSFLIDFTLLKIADYWSLDQTSVLITFATSYITLVYLTRTFSNSIETILFTLLIYLVVKSIKSQHILSDKFLIASNNSPKHKQPVIVASTSPDLVPSTLFDSKRNEASHKSTVMKRVRLFDIYKCDYLGSKIGILVCVGIFNRPTFIVFALMPVVYWLLYGLENCNNFKQCYSFIWRRLFALSKLTLPVLVVLVMADTIYYLDINDLSNLIDLVYKKKNLVITPYNFIVYNTNASNLKSHGAHPFYLHSLVNCALLFGVNHLILVYIFGKFFLELFNYVKSTRKSLLESDSAKSTNRFRRFKLTFMILYEQVINNRFCFLMFSFLTPLVLLSLMPHQEARFLLPLLIPACLLTSHCLFGSHSYIALRVLWLSFNALAFVLFGYLHQGGMVPSLAHVQKMFTQSANLELDMHVVYYQTYMPPNFLTQTPFSVNVIQNKRYIHERNRKKQLEIEENLGFSIYSNEISQPKRHVFDLMASTTLGELNKLLADIKANYTKNERVKKDIAVFLITPAVLDSRLYKPEDECSIKSDNQTNIGFQFLTRFKFHISFEHLKAHLDLLRCNFKHNDCYLNRCLRRSFLDRLLNSFSLNF